MVSTKAIANAAKLGGKIGYDPQTRRVYVDIPQVIGGQIITMRRDISAAQAQVNSLPTPASPPMRGSRRVVRRYELAPGVASRLDREARQILECSWR